MSSRFVTSSTESMMHVMDSDSETSDASENAHFPRAFRANPLKNVHVVLVEPQGPRNLGAVARAMLNFGLENLRIFGGVPKDSKDALDNAVNAKPLLLAALQVPTLDEALAGVTFVVATTAKRRHRVPTLRPRSAARRILDEAARGEVAILFGREDHGLNAEELRRAHAVIAVETAPECRALNLSHAVLLIAYELFLESGRDGIVADSEPGKLLPDELRQRLRAELLESLSVLQIRNDGNAIQLEQSIDRLLTLGPMQTRDARVLFTLARKIRELPKGSDR